MKQIQLVGTTLEEHYKFMFNYIDKKFENLEKNYHPKEPTTYLSRKETAKLLKVDVSTLWNWHQKKTLIPHSIGNRILYDRKDISEAIVKLNK